MAPLTKDTLEIANPAGESAASQSPNQAKPAAGHMRSDAVSLEVSVRVHGSKVKDIVLGTTPHTEPFEEQTITMIIFPQGAVLKMVTPVNSGQMLVLTNLKSRQDAICRVVKVRPNANLAAYVEVEFTNRQPGYWGVNFPSDAPALAAKVAPVVDEPPAIAEPPKPLPDVSWAPAPPSIAQAPKPLDANPVVSEMKPAATRPQPFTPPAKPEPSFISIGSQEEVQPAASATATIKPGTPRESLHENFAPFAPKTPAATEIPAAPPASLSMPELRGDSDAEPSGAIVALEISGAQEQELLAAAAPSPSPESSRNTFGSFAGGGTLAAARSSSSESFGMGLDSGEATSGNQIAAPGKNWILIAACAGLLIAGSVAGLFYLRGNSSKSGPAPARPAAAPSAQSAPATQPLAAANAAQPATANVRTSPTPQTNSSGTPGATVSATNPAKPAAAAKPPAPKVTTDMVSQALNAHPTASQRADDASADVPSLADDSTPAPPQAEALPGISTSNNIANLTPPTIQPDGPVKIGGNVKEPRLVSSVVPVYPIGAMQAGVQGDVVIQTTIDKDGKVVQMHVISGPTMLRQAALDALRRWKYEPSMLDGQPVAVEMQVTIKFRR
jgi:periplasmic protein TonB